MVVRSDVKKLTACREVAGLYNPRRTKSRLNDIAKTQAAEPLLTLSAWPRQRFLRWTVESSPRRRDSILNGSLRPNGGAQSRPGDARQPPSRTT
jgi:hypothetical protein